MRHLRNIAACLIMAASLAGCVYGGYGGGRYHGGYGYGGGYGYSGGYGYGGGYGYNGGYHHRYNNGW
jgi:hypothetical protein